MAESDEGLTGLRILAARNALFEVDLDLGRWVEAKSDRLDGFVQRLSSALPTLWEHKCMMGEPGGFVREMQQGTNLAHVVEHVLLELLHLADPDRRIYSGWTNPKKGKNGEPLRGVYTIHFQILSSAQGRTAALCGMKLVEDLLEGRTPPVDGYLDRLKETFQWSDTKDE